MTFSRYQLALLSPKDHTAGAIDQWGKVRANASGHPEHPFHRRIAKPALDQAQHRLGDTGSLGDGVLGEFPAFALALQKPDDLLSDCFVMSDAGHDEGWRQNAFDTHCHSQVSAHKQPIGEHHFTQLALKPH
jgi:hypothetical protein